MLLLEIVLRGNLFVDVDDNNLGSEGNVQLLLDFLSAIENGERIKTTKISKNKNKENVNFLPAEFLQYMQDLFSNRLKAFTSVKLDRNNDSHGHNQTWINISELDRISFLPLKEIIIGYLKKHSVNEINFTANPISFVIDGLKLQQFKLLEEGHFMPFGKTFTTEKNGLIFEWELKLMRSHSVKPDYCFLFLLLHRMPPSCRSIFVSYDVICPEMKLLRVNEWGTFREVNEDTGIHIFNNAELHSFTISLCIRILYCNLH